MLDNDLASFLLQLSDAGCKSGIMHDLAMVSSVIAKLSKIR